MIGVILLIGFIFRLILSFFGTYWGDMHAWIGWSERLLTVGFKDFYLAWSDYLPGYLYILWLLGQVKDYLAFLKISLPDQVLFKLPSILADCGTGFLIYKLIAKLKDKKTALWATAIYLANPAVWFNSSLWGQADGFASFFILLSLFLLVQQQFLVSAIILGLACIVKPLAFFLIPLFILYLLLKKKIKVLIYYLALVILFIFIPFIPFNNQNIFNFIINRFLTTFNQYPYTSLNAFNFWGLVLPFWTQDKLTFLGLSYKNWGVLILALIYLLIIYKIIKQVIFKKVKESRLDFYLIYASGLILSAAFMFLTRMHERHLLPLFPFLSIIAVFNPLAGVLYIFSSLIYCLNLTYAYIALTSNFKQIFSLNIIHLLSLLQIIIFILLLTVFIRFKTKFRQIKKSFKVIRGNFFTMVKGLKPIKDKPVIVPNSKLYLTLILLFAFVVRFYNIWHPQAYIFDEVYHGFTAQEMAKGNKMAWEWWNTPPQGFAYEWTHPPLAKLIMAGGVLLFGKNDNVSQYAFRFPAIFFGVGCIWLTYLLAKLIFNNEKIGLLSAFLLCFDGLAFVMSRLGMADIYFLFFMLLTIYWAVRKKYLLAGIGLGLSLVTKWTGMYLYPVVGIILISQLFTKIKQNKKQVIKLLSYWVISFIIIPALVYFIVYLPFFTSGHGMDKFLELQKQMWWYHTNLKATHNYQSSALSWPLMLRPVWFWVDYKENTIANIYNLGNPLLWWSGVLVLPWIIYYAVKRFLKNRDSRLGLMVICYFAFWLPWIASPRIMFLHHYLPAIPFMCILIAWFLNRSQNWILDTGNWKLKVSKLIIYYLLLIAITFFWFYPIYTGLPVPKNLLPLIFWFPSWK